MKIDLRQPVFQGTDKEKLEQMAIYLFQVREQLQWAFENIDESGQGGTSVVNTTTVINQTSTPADNTAKPLTEDQAELTFSAMKALIIKSADIVNAYHAEISKRISLSGDYVASSDFGVYKKETKAEIDLNTENIEINQEKVEQIQSVFMDEGDYAMILKKSGYIKTGFLPGGAYGIEIGVVTEEDGEKKEKSVGRFTSTRIIFYDQNGAEGAWLSNRRLYAAEVEATEKSQLGGFVDEVDPETGDVTTKWVGRGG